MPARFDDDSRRDDTATESLAGLGRDLTATTIIDRIPNARTTPSAFQVLWSKRVTTSHARTSNRSSTTPRQLLIIVSVTVLVVLLGALAGFGALGIL